MSFGTSPHLQLPVIDFCKSAEDLKPGTSEWESVRSQVWEAISEYGYFNALFDKISVDNQETFLCGLKELFDLPEPTKSRYVSEIPFNGYDRFVSETVRESFGIHDPLTLENCNHLCNALRPQGNPTLSKHVQYFSKHVSELEKIIRRMILESLSLDKYLDEHVNSTCYHFRLMKYEGLQVQSTERKPITRPHTDKSFITILYQNQVNGLEVQTKDGEQISVNLSPNHSFLVIIGDSFGAWTNGRLHSPYHSVNLIGKEDR